MPDAATVEGETIGVFKMSKCRSILITAFAATLFTGNGLALAGAPKSGGTVKGNVIINSNTGAKIAKESHGKCDETALPAKSGQTADCGKIDGNSKGINESGVPASSPKKKKTH